LNLNDSLKMPENRSFYQHPDALVVRPDIFLAIISGILRLFLFFGLLCGVYWLLIFVIGDNPFVFFLELFLIEPSFVALALQYAALLISLVYIFSIIISLNLRKMEFADERIIYTSGVFFVERKEIEYSDTVKTNFHQYGFLNIGSLRIEFTGSVPFVEFPYVAGVRKKAELIMRRISDYQAKGLAERIYFAGKGNIEQEVIERITSAVTQERFSRQGFVTQMASLSKKQKLSKDVFEVILSYMLKTNKIEKRDVLNVLFELMNQQVISRKDVSEVLFRISGERI
jgi:hypothetical protein